MKPRTKIQRRIVELSSALPSISQKQLDYGYRHCFEHEAWGSAKKGEYYCMDCGTQITCESSQLILSICDTKIKCPGCSTRVKIIDTRARKKHITRYYCITTTAAEFQVLRFIELSKHLNKTLKYEVYFKETVQVFLNLGENNRYIVACQRNQTDSFIHSSDLEIRIPNRYGYYDPYNISPYAVFVQRVQPILRRNGISKSFVGPNPATLFRNVLCSPRHETLVKAEQYALIGYFEAKQNFNSRWPSIKIALRNKYKIADCGLWNDMLSALDYFGKDLRNPLYVRPKNLKKAHDYWTNKRRQAIEKITGEQKRKQAAAQEAKFQALKAKFIGIIFLKGDIKIETLDSALAHVEEGEAMHHCVGSYATRADSLVFSARSLDNGERIATIEVSLVTFKVLQCRGLCNNTVPQQAKILEIMNQNMNKIKQIA